MKFIGFNEKGNKLYKMTYKEYDRKGCVPFKVVEVRTDDEVLILEDVSGYK